MNQSKIVRHTLISALPGGERAELLPSGEVPGCDDGDACCWLLVLDRFEPPGVAVHRWCTRETVHDLAARRVAHRCLYTSATSFLLASRMRAFSSVTR